MKKLFLLLCVLGLAALAVAGVQYHRLSHLGEQAIAFKEGEPTVLFEVKKGQSASAVARGLERQGFIEDANKLRAYLKISKQGRGIKAGHYRLEKGMSIDQALALFESGVSVQYKVTAVEGIRFKDFLALLHKHPNIKRTMPKLDNTQAIYAWVMNELGEKGQHPEGLFLPETYFFSVGDTEIEVLKRARKAMKKTLEEVWPTRDKNLKLNSPYEALILASIIEKETGAAHERPLISGVFHNRLNKGMKLQTDPTIIYGMGDEYKGDIRFKDLRKDTPYNTYTRYGLTPTPIALPGKEAIVAALKPAKTKALYFVSRNDGTHVFSNTLKQHNRAVDKYQRRSKKK